MSDGATLGMTGVLHTWGRQMQRHPHIHYIVPGGGWNQEKGCWLTPRKPDWLLPHRAVAAVYRAQLAEGLRARLPQWHAQIPVACWRQPWVVDMAHVGRGQTAIKYLARYVQRTAISDHRVQAMSDDEVRFGYRDSATGAAKTCPLRAAEFMRRYLMHVLPTGVLRVRYFGWEHPGAGATTRGDSARSRNRGGGAGRTYPLAPTVSALPDPDAGLHGLAAASPRSTIFDEEVGGMSRAAQSRLIIDPVLAVKSVRTGGARAEGKKVMRFAHHKCGYVVKKRTTEERLHAMGKEKNQRGRKFGEAIRRGGAAGHHRLKYKTHKA